MSAGQGSEHRGTERHRSPRNNKRDYSWPPSSTAALDNGRAMTDRIAAGLEASSHLAGEIGHPGPDIRPCIAILIETSLKKGEFPNRNVSALIIACEYRRIGIDYDTACHRVARWNEDNKPPLRPNDLTRAVNNAFAKDYNYTCNNAILGGLCIGTDVCPFRTRVIGGKAKYNNFAFIDYGWPDYLTNRQVLIYHVALPYLERKRRIGQGGLICANHSQIAKACGIRREQIGKDLRCLAVAGLIEYQAGTARKWEGIASEVKRVFPIPRPTKRLIGLVRQCVKTHPRQCGISHNIIQVSNPILEGKGMTSETEMENEDNAPSD